MKLLYCLLPIILLQGCGYSQQQTAQALVKKYLDSTLNDPKSYEAVSFSNIEPTYANNNNNPEYRKYTFLLLNFELKHDTVSAAFKDAKRKLDSVDQKYKTVVYGWQISHTFRDKNGYGAVIKETKVFDFDKSLKAVTSATNPKE